MTSRDVIRISILIGYEYQSLGFHWLRVFLVVGNFRELTEHRFVAWFVCGRFVVIARVFGYIKIPKVRHFNRLIVPVPAPFFR